MLSKEMGDTRYIYSAFINRDTLLTSLWYISISSPMFSNSLGRDTISTSLTILRTMGNQLVRGMTAYIAPPPPLVMSMGFQ